jgi:hypothetical protein
MREIRMKVRRNYLVCSDRFRGVVMYLEVGLREEREGHDGSFGLERASEMPKTVTPGLIELGSKN